MNREFSPEQVHDDQWFMSESLELHAKALQAQTYPGYPTLNERLQARDLSNDEYGILDIPFGPGWVQSLDYWRNPDFEQQFPSVSTYDTQRRPLHPWLNDMLQRPDISFVAGKGAYWNWGPNYTADPIIIRTDLETPHILLIKRKDTGNWALPGGFIDGNESAEAAAIREAHEEAGITLAAYVPKVTQIYSGPIVDLRMTMHAWPETTATLFELHPSLSSFIPTMQYEGTDDAEAAAWVPVDAAQEGLFGSHKLLVQLALEHMSKN
jgi:8-oxo-dGTP pyrophosphatase MutT (NUDIX family)